MTDIGHTRARRSVAFDSIEATPAIRSGEKIEFAGKADIGHTRARRSVAFDRIEADTRDKIGRKNRK